MSAPRKPEANSRSRKTNHGRAAVKATHTRLQHIARITRKPVGSVSSQGHAEEMVEQALMVFSASACVIRVLEGEDLVLLAQSGLPPESRHPRIPIGWGISKQIMEMRHPVFIPDVCENPLTAPMRHRLPHAFDFISYAGAPLWAGEDLIGILGLYWAERLGTFADIDMACLQILANSMSVAIANDRLYEEITRARDRLVDEVARRRLTEQFLQNREAILEVVAQAATQMLKPVPWDSVAGDLLNKLGETLEVARSFIYQIQPGEKEGFRVTCRAEWSRPGLPTLTSAIPDVTRLDISRERFAGWLSALSAGEPISTLTRTLPEWEKELVGMFGTQSLLLVPIHIAGALWGVTGFAETATERFWTDIEIDAVRVSAGVLTAALERERAEEITRRWRSRLTHADRVFTLSKLAVGLAHEINQPLASIANYAEACMLVISDGRAEPREVLADLESIAAQACRVSSVVRRLRELMKYRPPRHEATLIDNLIRDVLTFLAYDLRREQVAVQLDFAQEIPALHTDPILVQQVLLNLIGNALDAMKSKPPDGRTLAISSAIHETGWVRVAVRDSGEGVEEQNIDKLFGLFFSTKDDGLGLGLPISREIIESLGGRIGAEPHAESGTTFWFSLPIT